MRVILQSRLKVLQAVVDSLYGCPAHGARHIQEKIDGQTTTGTFELHVSFLPLPHPGAIFMVSGQSRLILHWRYHEFPAEYGLPNPQLAVDTALILEYQKVDIMCDLCGQAGKVSPASVRESGSIKSRNGRDGSDQVIGQG